MREKGKERGRERERERERGGDMLTPNFDYVSEEKNFFEKRRNEYE